MTINFAPTCSTADVATLLLDRVNTTGGDFTANTYPTQAKVTGLIAQVAGRVQARVGTLVDDSLTAFAKLVVATGVAAQVELAFTDDDGQDAQSKYQVLNKEFLDMLKELGDAESRIETGGDVEEGGIAFGQFSVPDTSQFRYPMTRAMERW